MTKNSSKTKKGSKKVKREIANVLNRNDRVRRKLLGMNPYAETLLDPFNHKGVRIPDEALYPSVPFTIVDRRTLTANAQGICGVCYGFRSSTSAVSKGSLVPLAINGDTVGSYSVGMSFGTNATISDLTAGTLNTTGPIDLKFTQWNASSFLVQSAFDKVRLVSAGLNVQCTSNFSSNSGKYTAAFATRNYSRAGSGNPYPVSYIQNLPSSRTVPISLEQGVTVVYEPCDEYCFRYAMIGINQDASGPVAYDCATFADWEQNLAHFSPGEMWVAVDGAPANATFIVTFVANYEGIPSTNNFLLGGMAQTSSSDPIAFTHALGAAASSPNVVASSSEANGTLSNLSPETFQVHQPSQSTEPRMFDSLMNVLSSAPEYIDKGKQLFEKAGPLIEQAMAFI